MDTSRLIYASWIANRYFQYACILWGFKTPAMCFYVCRKGWRQSRGSMWVADSNVARLFVIFQHITLLFYIIFLFYFVYKQLQLAEWWETCSFTTGTWVRFPGPLIILILFFQKLSCAAFQALDTMSLTHPTSQVSLEADLKAQKARVPCAQSKRAIGNPRKSTSWRFNGPQIQQHTPIPGPTPPSIWLILLYSFFFQFNF